MQGGGGSRLSRTSNINPCDWTKKMAKPVSGCVATVQACVSKTGRWRNWTMPPLRPERECREWPNSATIDNRCEEFDRRENKREAAFTMAEILLSLTIIGVVAAITLPSLTGNINERTWNTQRKALYARMSQAVSLMPALNGYGVGATDAETAANATEVFITNGLAKVLKINNICDHEHLADCGLPSKILTMKGVNNPAVQLELSDMETLIDFNPKFASWTDTANSTLSYSGNISTNAAAFETANGESILTYYSPNCNGNNSNLATQAQSGSNMFVQPFMCANFVYDLNGKKGPNTMGRDVGFISVLYPSDPVVVAPMPVIEAPVSAVPFTEVGKKCREINDQSRAPNFEELASMFYNRALLQSVSDGADVWSGSRTVNYVGQPAGILLKFRTGTFVVYNGSAGLRCIQR